MKNIYNYLDEIKFEERIKERCKLISKCNINNSIVSEFVMKQFCFGLLRDLFEKIYDDITIDTNKKIQ